MHRWTEVRSRQLARTLALASSLGVLVACNAGFDGSGTNDALMFPFEGQLGPPGGGTPPKGTTVTWVIDSNYFPMADDYERFDLHRNNLQVRITDDAAVPQWGPVTIPTRAVFELRPAAWSKRNEEWKGAFVTVTMFDLPSVSSMGSSFDTVLASEGYPQAATLELRTSGGALLGSSSTFQIQGEAGKPNPIMDALVEPDFVFSLEERRMIRVRPTRAVGAFDETLFSGVTLGSIEFDLEWNPDCGSGISAFAQSEAHLGTTLVGPTQSLNGGATKRAHVVYLDPKGFTLAFLGSGVGGDVSVAGEGPVLDLLFAPDDPPGNTCTPINPTEDFTVKNLVVSNLAGATVINDAASPSNDSTSKFTYYVVEPPTTPAG